MSFTPSMGGLSLEEFENLVREQEVIRSGITEQLVAQGQRKQIAEETIARLQEPIT